MKMRNKSKGLIRRKIICAALLMMTVVLIAGCKKKMTLQDYLDLGDKYLVELNYEEAIVAFNKVIEMEPRDPQGYLKLAKVYDAKEDYEMAVQILTQGYEATSDEDVKKQKEIYENLISHEDLIQETMTRMQTLDKDNIWQFQSSDEYQSFTSKLDRVIKRDCGDGNWILIYPCGHCYYGGMEDGKRSGQGIWCDYDYVTDYMEYASCTWKDDYPNGAGEQWHIPIDLPEDPHHIWADFEDGLYQGIVETEYRNSVAGVETVNTYSCNYTDGIPEEVEDPYGIGNHTEDGKEWFCIYSDKNMNFFAARGSKYGMIHAEKMESEECMKAYSMEQIQKGKKRIEAERQENLKEMMENGRVSNE